ncbi:MAG TPA: cohesin domain-containing protein [Acidobacteriaceae bacterium]|nr:cohesin domain-containing protein [Acidobacteriaceae bacterium]
MTRGFPLLTKKLGDRAWRVSLCALFLLMALGASSRSACAQSASGWDKRGQAAELREDYDTAYEDYLKAHLKSPKDMRYQARLDRMRFQAAAQHVDRGRVLRESGDIAGALNQFTRAKQIDPSNEAASQEIALTERQDRSSAAAPLSTMPSASTAAMQQEVGSVAAPAMLKGISSEPITLHIVEDVKNIYTTIGQMAGLNVLFDPDYTSKRIQVDLKNVSLSDALHVIGVQSQTFYKPVTADTIYVAANTFTKHADLDEEAVQTFYLTNSVGQADANDIATVLRNILGSAPGTAIVPMISQNAIVVRESPDKLLLVEKLINDLDRPRAEVVVDVAILEVNRDKVRNLGITLPQSVGLTPQQTPNSTNTSDTGTTTTAQASNFTLNTLGHFNSTNLAVTIGGGTLNALMTDADTRVLQNPSVRATDGQKATLKIGSKIPVATGSFGAATGIGGGTLGGLGVNTQFNYLDVGVTIDMTPSIHLDRQVSMVLDVENSTETGQATLAGGVTQPIIGTRSDKTTIQLRDGEPCLLAAILTKQDNTSNSGTPGLSSIPLLKYLFGSVYKEKQQDEVVFVLVPHIVRESTLTGLNTRAIDTGTAQDIEIRRSDPSAADLAVVNSGSAPNANVTAANAASAMVQQMKQQAMPQVAGSNGAAVSAIVTAPAPSMPAPAAGIPVLVSVLPANSAHAVGSTFQTSIVLSNGHDVFSVPMQLQFDPKVLQLVNVDAGGLLAGGGQPVALVHRDDGNGLVTISASRPPGASGVDGQGEVCTLTFKAVGAGDTSVSLVKVGAKSSQQANLPTSSSQGVVHVK